MNYKDLDDERVFFLDNENLTPRGNKLEDELKNYIENSSKNISLDFDKIRKIDSLTLALLVRIQQKLDEDDRELKLINISESINSVLEWSGLDDKFIIE